MVTEQNYVVKISSALSNKPIYVKITDPTMSIDRIFTEAISTLRNAGKPLESQQLEQLYKQHQIYNNSQVVQKGDLFQSLKTKVQLVGDQSVTVAELDLVSAHSGGMERTHMKNITISLPNVYVDNLEKLQKLGMIPSRSEGIRLAVFSFIKKETQVLKLFGVETN